MEVPRDILFLEKDQFTFFHEDSTLVVKVYLSEPWQEFFGQLIILSGLITKVASFVFLDYAFVGSFKLVVLLDDNIAIS